MTTAVVSTQIVPQEPASLPGPAAPPTRGVADALESVLSDNTRRVYGTQWRLLHRLVRRDGSAVSAGGAPHRGPLPGRPRRLRRQHCHHAPGHQRHRQGPRVGEAGIALPGPGRARLFKGMGQTPCQTPAPVRRPHRRCARRHPPHRRPAPPRGRGFETPEQAAERGKFDVALVAVLSDAGLRRSEASSLTWGDVQRWDDGSGRITVIRSKTDVEAQGAVVAITPAAMQALDAIRPVGVGGEREGVRVVGVADRPTGEGDCQSRGISGLGILQRPQRAGGHGPSDGPERRAHPRDRAPGPMEAGRWHGRPLHPRRIRRVGVAVSVTVVCRTWPLVGLPYPALYSRKHFTMTLFILRNSPSANAATHPVSLSRTAGSYQLS